MPSFIYDSLYHASMDKFPSFHEHSNGDISEIQGRVKDVQVMFLKRSAEIDFLEISTLIRIYGQVHLVGPSYYGVDL